MTNEDIAQRWVETIPVIRRHIEIAVDPEIWQSDPKKTLAAIDRIDGLKKWCLNVMEQIPEMESYFLQEIEERGSYEADSSRHLFSFVQQQQPPSNIDQET